MDTNHDWILIATLTAITLILGWATGAWGWACFGGLALWSIYQYREYRKIRRWSRNPLKRPANALDAWYNLAYPPYRGLQRQRERTQRVTQRVRQLLRLTQHIPDGVIVLATTGEIEGVNAAAQRLLQITDADRGLMLSTIVRSPMFVQFLKEEVMEAPLEFSSPVEDGITLEARRFDTEDQGSIILVRDITALNRLLTVRQEFVANVSHELRTPLAVMQGYMETLSDPQEDPALRLELISRLESPLDRLQSLVNDLLLLTRLESQEDVRRHSPFSLSRVVEDSVRQCAVLTDAQRIQTSITEDLRMIGNEEELRSVCTNLISNAIRYSPDGGDIEVQLTQHDGRLTLAVRDHGVGIAPEHLDRLTERFYRVDMADARARGGTGLGLAIVKHVLRRHESNLEIESHLGEGSTFSCAFDVYDPEINHEAQTTEVGA